MTRVLMVSTSYPADLSDWRGLFMRHLTAALARRDGLQLQVWSPPGEMPGNVDYVANDDERRWLVALMAAGGIAHLMRQRGLRALAAPVQLLAMLRAVYRRNADVALYHVNWLQNALPLPRNGRPLLVTVLGTDLQLLQLPLMRWLLRRAFRGRRVVICPNADWMLPALDKAFGDVAQVRFVPFGIDPAWFQIQRLLDGPAPARWLCVTRLTKGKIGPLFEWCQPFFADGRRELHLFGPMQESTDLPDWVHYHGPASPGTLCRDWFPFAHGLITLSRHAEGRPQVMLEAMAAGPDLRRLSLNLILLDCMRGSLTRDGLVDAGADAMDAPFNRSSLEALSTLLDLSIKGQCGSELDVPTWRALASAFLAKPLYSGGEVGGYLWIQVARSHLAEGNLLAADQALEAAYDADPDPELARRAYILTYDNGACKMARKWWPRQVPSARIGFDAWLQSLAFEENGLAPPGTCREPRPAPPPSSESSGSALATSDAMPQTG